MSSIKYLVVAVLFSCTGCALIKPEVKSTEYLTLEVTTMRLTPNALVMHLDDGEVSAEDIVEVKVNTPGPYLNTTLPISIPALDTASYNRFVAAVPARKGTWALFRSPNRNLVIQVRQGEVDDYLRIKDDKSRVLPSISVFELKGIAAKAE